MESCNEINKTGDANLQVLANLHKFTELLDTIEISIKIKLETNLSELKNLRQTIDDDIKVFKIICENTV